MTTQITLQKTVRTFVRHMQGRNLLCQSGTGFQPGTEISIGPLQEMSYDHKDIWVAQVIVASVHIGDTPQFVIVEELGSPNLKSRAIH
jgi:hypothetical protein